MQINSISPSTQTYNCWQNFKNWVSNFHFPSPFPPFPLLPFSFPCPFPLFLSIRWAMPLSWEWTEGGNTVPSVYDDKQLTPPIYEIYTPHTLLPTYRPTYLVPRLPSQTSRVRWRKCRFPPVYSASFISQQFRPDLRNPSYRLLYQTSRVRWRKCRSSLSSSLPV